MILWARFVLILLIFAPVLPIYAIEGISSVIRLDLILSIFLVIFLFADPGFRRHLTGVRKLFVVMSLIFVYLCSSSNLFIALAQVLLYASIYCAYYLGVETIQDGRKVFLEKIYVLLAINCLIHVFYHIFRIDSFFINHANGIGQIENDVIFGLFGISKMPFQFILYVGFFIFLAIIRRGKNSLFFYLAMILGFFSAATSESRVGFFALLLGMFFTFRPTVAAAVSLVAIAVIPFVITEKMSFILEMDYTKIAEDPSIGMRLINLENFMNWFSLDKILFGGGAFANLQFTSTYGEPGALDMLFVRLLAEFGFLITAIGLMYFAFNLWGKFIDCGGEKRRIIIGWVFFLFVYSFLNEGVIASRSGHLVFFAFGLFLSNQVGRKFARIS